MDISEYKHNKTSERIISVLRKHVPPGVTDEYLRMLASFTLCFIASQMNVKVTVKNTKKPVLVNGFFNSIGGSGSGKTFTMRLIRETLLKEFNESFEGVMARSAERNIEQLAHQRASNKDNGNVDAEYDSLVKQLKDAGPYVPVVSACTEAFVRDIGERIKICQAGSSTLIIDEFGLKLKSMQPYDEAALLSFMELFDDGLKDEQGRKNSNENKRTKELKGKIPVNFLSFGTPDQLFDDEGTSKKFMRLMESGLARRIFMSYLPDEDEDELMSYEERLARLEELDVDTDTDALMQDLGAVAQDGSLGAVVSCGTGEVRKLLVLYEYECEKRARNYKKHKVVLRKALANSYFKAVKLAGAYAFAEGSQVVKIEHLQSAILVAEESQVALEAMMSRPKNYVRLAEFLADDGRALNYADIDEEIKFLPNAANNRKSMMDLARAWGMSNGVPITTVYANDIETFQAKKLEANNMHSDIIFSMNTTNSQAPGFIPAGKIVPFIAYNEDGTLDTCIMRALGEKGNNKKAFCNHRFNNNHRNKENMISGFNMLVFDIDGGTPIKQIELLLHEYTYGIYTTRSHGIKEGGDRFRLLIPTSHTLELTYDEYTAFIDNVLLELPIEIDSMSRSAVHRWSCADNSQVIVNEGSLFNVMKFIPNTKSSEEFITNTKHLSSHSAIERYFGLNMRPNENRNSMFIRYGLLLVDLGLDLNTIQERILEFNKKLGKDKLPEAEFHASVFITVAKTIAKRKAESSTTK